MLIGRRAEQEFDLFVLARSAPMYRTALLLCGGDTGLAADAVQTAMLELWRRWPRVRAMERADGYATRVVATTALRDRRGRWSTVEVSADPPDVAAEPTDHATRHDMWAAIQQLPRMQRAVVVLRFYEDMTEVQTAEVLGIGVGTVKSHCSRALASLRAVVGHEYLSGGAT